MIKALPGVTLCCVDTTDRFDWAVDAMRRSMAQLRFGTAVMVSTAEHLAALPADAGIRGIPIRPLRSTEDYSQFVVHDLPALIPTPHALIVQWDGFVIHPQSWSDEFLAFDYIGAPWRHLQGPYRVGNGGFSLRSKRLMDAVADRAAGNVHPEDSFICLQLRPQLESLGMRFAPEAVAARFAIENGSLRDRPLGFHGPAHFPHVLGPQGTQAYLQSVKPPTRLLSDAGWQIVRGIGSSIDELVRVDRRFEQTRAVLGDLLHASLQAQSASGVPPAQLPRLCKDLSRLGYVRLARECLRLWGEHLDARTRAALTLRTHTKAVHRRLQALPVD